MFHVVLVEPAIPQNTGNIGRLCLATGCTLHLVDPLGFSLEDRFLKRAGLDYWERVNPHRWPSIYEVRKAASPSSRFLYFSTKAEKSFWSADYRSDDYLVFGCETRGLPEELLQENWNQCYRIPIEQVRSLNLASSVGIVVYEGLRQARDA